ncbi:SPOR domain-containing protein [Acidimangrovimonas sediminis]|uniref:SPOR domain-containing protein n=1 Tax=Acidimangrovimonas sediminis TaxID=2056283 RepID=UPI000C804140|nr:SPOR domain-containing protein [Acidimangrovimonas sediminis]
MAGPKVSALVLMAFAGVALAGCQDGQQPFGFLKKKDGAATADAAGTGDAVPQSSSVKLVDRDVEAPDVFQVSTKGLWDGRPSLGGVWVAYPGVKDPERVIIRNPKNGKFVIGALFRREINNPGPKLQLSSDAATALGLVAGEPANVSVTALRRQEAPVPAPDAKNPALASNEQIKTKPLGDVAAKAGAAIDRAEAKGMDKTAKAPAMKPSAMAAGKMAGATAGTAAKAGARTEAKAAPATSGRREFVQIGIFSVEANAKRAAGMVTKAGANAQVTTEESQGKTFWRVLAGPATSASQRASLLDTVKKLGFKDAFYISR